MMAPQNGARPIEARVASLEEDNAQIRADVLTLAGQQATALAEVNGKLDRLLEIEAVRTEADTRKSQEDAAQDVRIARLENASATTAASVPKIAAASATVKDATTQVQAATTALAAVAETLPAESKLKAWLPILTVVALAVLEVYRLAKGSP